MVAGNPILLRTKDFKISIYKRCFPLVRNMSGSVSLINFCYFEMYHFVVEPWLSTTQGKSPKISLNLGIILVVSQNERTFWIRIFLKVRIIRAKSNSYARQKICGRSHLVTWPPFASVCCWKKPVQQTLFYKNLQKFKLCVFLRQSSRKNHRQYFPLQLPIANGFSTKQILMTRQSSFEFSRAFTFRLC